MNNISEPSIVFTRKGELILSFGDKDEVLVKELKNKFHNKMSFLVSLFDLPVKLEEKISFNQVLHNLKFFEKEFEVFFSEIKIPKNNIAAQKIFELLKDLNSESSNFLNIMNEEKNQLDNSLLKHNINQDLLELLEKKSNCNKKVNILIKKIVSEKQVINLLNKEKKDINISLITKSKIYQDGVQVLLSSISSIELLSSKISIDKSGDINYQISFEDMLKCLFKDLLIFRTKEEIKIWREEMSNYSKIYANNVVYLNEFKNLLKLKKKEKEYLNVNPFITRNNKELDLYLNHIFKIINIEVKKNKNLTLVSVNNNITPERSNAILKLVKK